MKNVLLLLIIIVFTSESNAQKFEGIATYKSQDKLNLKFGDSTTTKANKKMNEQFLAFMKKQTIQEFILEFNFRESIYKKVEKLRAANSNSAINVGNGISFGGGGGSIEIGSGKSRETYKNLTKGKYTKKADILGKDFLIKDNLKKRNWVITNELRNIGEFECKKATSAILNKDGEEVLITAWYTSEIPVQNGPEDFGGLPGLIMQIYSEDGSLNIICSNVILNPKKGVTIKEPRRGKVVSQSEFDKIHKKKMKEMELNSVKMGNGIRAYTTGEN